MLSHTVIFRDFQHNSVRKPLKLISKYRMKPLYH